MTITEKERRKLIGHIETSPVPSQRFQRSGVGASLLGMLAGLGALVLITATLAAGAILLDLRFDLTRADGTVRELSATGLVIAIVVTLLAAFVGGFVAGRTARYGGMAVGAGASLWLTLVLLSFTALTLGIGAVSDRFDGFGLADRLSRFDAPGLQVAGLIAAGGLFLLVVLMGLFGGRVGEDKVETSTRVVDISDLDSDEDETDLDAAQTM